MPTARHAPLHALLRALLHRRPLVLGTMLFASGCRWDWDHFPIADGAIVDAGADASADAGIPVQRSCVDAPEAIGCGVWTVTNGGPFTLGEAGTCPDDEGVPLQRAITVSSTLDVDRYEVTVARFRRFWAAGRPTPASGALIGYPVPNPDPTGVRLRWDGALREPLLTSANSACNWSTDVSSREAHPINCVDWDTAMAFCIWDGGRDSTDPRTGRLPTEAEWEWIARHRRDDGHGNTLPAPRPFAWGDEAPTGSATTPCTRAHVNRCVGDDGAPTRRVGSFDATAGLFDLTGNVSEWAGDAMVTYRHLEFWNDRPGGRIDPHTIANREPGRTIKGGAYEQTSACWHSTAARAYFYRTTTHPAIGFRCVRAVR